MGAYKNVIKLPPRPPRPTVKTEPATGTDRDNVLRSPAPALTAVKQEPDQKADEVSSLDTVDREMPLSNSPLSPCWQIVIVTDSEPEPDTEDDDVEMQPVERDKSSAARLVAEPSQAKPQMAPMQIDDGGDGDSEPEPDTEDDEPPPTATFLASVRPGSSSQTRQPALAFGSSQSQADSQQRRLSSAGGPPVKIESQNEIMVDEDSEDLEDDMSRALKARLEREVRRKEAAAAKKRQEEAAARKAEQRRVIQEQIDAGLRELQANNQSLMLPSDDEEEDDAEKRALAVQAVRTKLELADLPRTATDHPSSRHAGTRAVPEAAGAQDSTALPNLRRGAGTDRRALALERSDRHDQDSGADQSLLAAVPARRCRVLVRPIQTRPWRYPGRRHGEAASLFSRRTSCRGVADDGSSQGLGKTIQAIAFLAAIMGAFETFLSRQTSD